MIRGGAPTAIDRQLGLGYGAGAVRALDSGQSGVMVAFQPPDLKFIPLAEAINKVRTVPTNGEFIQIQVLFAALQVVLQSRKYWAKARARLQHQQVYRQEGMWPLFKTSLPGGGPCTCSTVRTIECASTGIWPANAARKLLQSLRPERFIYLDRR
jgi:hypothetical protein